MSNKIRFKVIIAGVLLVLIVSINVASCVKKPKTKVEAVKETISDKVITKVETKISKEDEKRMKELEEELRQKKEKEYEEELRRIKLEKLQNPEIINAEMESVGKLVVYKGKANYSNTFDESKFLRPKKISVNLQYKFGISMDLKNIVVSEFIEDVVVLKIHKDQLEIEYVELDEESIEVSEEVKLLAKEYTKEDLNKILTIGKSATLGRIQGNKDIHDKAIESLKNNVQEMVMQLGYRKVIVEVL